MNLGKFITLHGTPLRRPGGKDGIYEWIERKPAVLILPVTAKKEVLLIRNYRLPLDQDVLECPAGLMDKENEKPEDAARRELREETGYESSDIRPLARWPYRAACSNGILTAFLACGCTLAGTQNLDPDEKIKVQKVSVANFENYLLREIENPYNLLVSIELLALWRIALDRYWHVFQK